MEVFSLVCAESRKAMMASTAIKTICFFIAYLQKWHQLNLIYVMLCTAICCVFWQIAGWKLARGMPAVPPVKFKCNTNVTAYYSHFAFQGVNILLGIGLCDTSNNTIQIQTIKFHYSHLVTLNRSSFLCEYYLVNSGFIEAVVISMRKAL